MCQTKAREKGADIDVERSSRPGRLGCLAADRLCTLTEPSGHCVFRSKCPTDPEFGSRSYPSVRAFNNSLFISSLPKISISPLAKKNGINTTNMSSMVAKTSLGSAAVSEKLAAKD